MRLIHDHRSEPPLPEMPGPVVAPVDARRIAAMRIGDGPPQAVFVGRRDDQMDMVGHQAPGPDLAPGVPHGGAQHLDIGAVIIIAEKHRLATIAPLGDMMGQTGNDNTRKSSHGGRL